MAQTLSEQIRQIAEASKEKEEAENSLSRLEEGSLTRDENPYTHFCVFFLPYNPQTKEVLIGDHKKSGLWLSPGGHIDRGKELLTAVNREISEELGVKNYFSQTPKPFLLTINRGTLHMKPHRVFIAINLPEQIKEGLLEYHNKWSDVPARWVSKENLHLTLIFLGNTSEAELRELIKICDSVGERHAPFELEISHVQYGPNEKRPRMIWAIIRKSQQLLDLQKDIAHSITRQETQQFSPHLTLARFNMMQFRQMEPEERPEIGEDNSLTFPVESIELMESILRRNHAQYSVLQRFMLQK